MKHLFFLVLVLTVISNCKVQKSNSAAFSNDKVWIPPNSKIDKGAQIEIQAPEGWIYVGYMKGAVEMAKNGVTKVSCDCLASGKCSPFAGNGPGGSTAGCAGSCTKCLMEQSLANNDISFDEGGYINLNINTQFIKKGQVLPAAFNAMFEIKEVKDKLNSFVKQIYKGFDLPKIEYNNGFIEAPKQYTFAMVNICNRAVALLVPKLAMASGGISANKASCSCTEGGCSLKSYNILIGSVSYCEGNCTGTCTLTTSISSGGGAGLEDKVVYEAIKYKF